MTQSNNKKPSLKPEQKLTAVLVTVCLCLFFIHYVKFSSVFDQIAMGLSALFYDNHQGYFLIRRHGFYELFAQAWWTGIHLFGYVVIPIVVIKVYFKESLKHYGSHWQNTNRYWLHYSCLALPIVIFAFFASYREDFTHTYPFYSLANRSYFDLLAWELLYGLQFIALEFFFRGFLLHGSQQSLKFNAIWLMSIPYLMIHFQKPWLEAFGALPFGLLLGLLALRSRSIWGGAMVHITIAFSMDFFSLMRSGQLPTQWWP
jgi:membrane protease YdiL (CAAX protease family)